MDTKFARELVMKIASTENVLTVLITNAFAILVGQVQIVALIAAVMDTLNVKMDLEIVTFV